MDLQTLQAQIDDAGLEQRESQREMISRAYEALKKRQIICVEAPTGTGKTLSYAIAAHYARKPKQHIIISTATVALQEQLVEKDLPLLQQILGVDFKFALAKGRRRYVCLARLFGNEGQDDLFAKDKSIEKLQTLYDQQRWSGDRDELSETVSDEVWQSISTDANGCSGKLCELFEDCVFYQARKKMHSADVVVTNHSLLLSDIELGSGAILPEIENNLYIIDECHHLPDKALNHFAKMASVMGSVDWINNLTKALTKAVIAGDVEESQQQRLNDITHDVVQHSKRLNDLLEANDNQFEDNIWRINAPSPELIDIARSIKSDSQKVYAELAVIVTHLEEKLQSLQPSDKETSALLSKSLNTFSFLSGRAENLYLTWELFCRENPKPPVARWFAKHNDHYFCHTSPINVSKELTTLLWDKLENGAILCSATIRALGKFDDYRRKTGLKDNSKLVELSIDSCFDYQKSILFVPSMQHAPTGKDQRAHRHEVAELLPQLILPEAGTLVLFTSRSAMHDIYEDMPDDLINDILMQGDKSKSKLISSHKNRIRNGDRSILFGLASFGEGLDLPADFCQHVIIHKLPFAVPSTPIELTRSEWLEQNNKNPFMMTSLPLASLRLTQYVGRLIRQETDFGVVTILDKRLYSKFYGKNLLDNLPGFKRLINRPIEEMLEAYKALHQKETV